MYFNKPKHSPGEKGQDLPSNNQGRNSPILSKGMSEKLSNSQNPSTSRRPTAQEFRTVRGETSDVEVSIAESSSSQKLSMPAAVSLAFEEKELKT